MSAIAFDTLKFVQTLQDAGFNEIQAKSVARAFNDAQHEANVATKADVDRLDDSIKSNVERLDDSIKSNAERLEHLIAQTNAQTRADIIKWVSGIALAQTLLLVGVLSKFIS
uniref:DUF1640 domain-containing protein n=1 Tax=Candidatus Kentrum sp. FW TaxID=2126338 RepID=A0A450TZB2_9GAMM|nr:MAG: hypothetical protein BECKFW1821C_GA0114237_107111 [Candidatus Kentron sp. FW]